MKTIIYFVSEDWYFCSHRLPIARECLGSGFRVIVITRVRKHGDVIRSEGFELVPIEIRRGGFNIFGDLRGIVFLYHQYLKYRPDIVHHVAIKPVVYGSIVAWLIGSMKVVNAMAGLGFLFISGRKKIKILRLFVHQLFRFLLNRSGCRVILQNGDDVKYFIKHGLVDREKISVIRGSGVDIRTFAATKESSRRPIVMLASRMLWDKGVGEFVDAATILLDEGIDARFVLVGESDLENPASISKDQLRLWDQSGFIEWWGQRNQMNTTLAAAHIICLPSYREGLPKVLLEAASCSRPIVATDVPGCREIVRDGENGILVPSRDSCALAKAIKVLINCPERRHCMGENGRQLVENEFSEEIVVKQTLRLYQELLT